MSFSFLGPDPVDAQVSSVLRALAEGAAPGDVERAHVDVKEEPARRGSGGTVLPGHSQNEAAAAFLAGEMACHANTPGGGAIILGIANDGQRIGTQLDAEWLRHRIWELTGGKLTAAAREVDLDGTRVLVLMTHEAVEPVAFRGRLRWRVDDNCVEIDPTTWHTDRLRRTGVDWSAQPSGHTAAEASPVALEMARRYLRAAGSAGDTSAQDLASTSDEDLLRRLHVLDNSGRLTNAGSLLFVATPTDGIDYMRREVPSGDSIHRARSSRALLEQIVEVEQLSEASNRLVHVPEGFAHGQIRAIPPRALREAIVNGMVHRDWLSPTPTSVEHIGDVVTVTSPGGFVGGVDPTNIITHPAVPRYRSLAEAVAALRLAEREGIGVDRMVRDMLALGHPAPEISEMPGPYVRVSLIGGEPDQPMLRFLAAVEPETLATDVDALLVVDHLIRHGWVDVDRVAPVLQRPPAEAAASLRRLAQARIDGGPLIRPVRGVPADSVPAYRLGEKARARLAGRADHLTAPEARAALLVGWAEARGRVSSTEASDLAGISVPYAGKVLTALEEEGRLRPSRPTKQGRGFYYLPA